VQLDQPARDFLETRLDIRPTLDILGLHNQYHERHTMFTVFRNAGDYDTRYSAPTVFYLTKDQADKAAADATDFIKRAGMFGFDASNLDANILHGDDDGSSTSWDAHVAAAGGLPAGDPTLRPGVFDMYGIHAYAVFHIPMGKVTE